MLKHNIIHVMITTRIEELLAEVKHVIAFAKKKIAGSPDGMLHTRDNSGTFRYYKRSSGDTCGQYLGKGREKVIKSLEEKEYYSRLLKTAVDEENTLKKIKNELENMPDYNSVFLNIPVEKRHLISPYEYSPKEPDDGIVRVFNKKSVKEELKLITQNGEHVRSKSELIIADRLKTAGVPYYYEDPLILSDGDSSKDGLIPCLYWHPDFRVQNTRTGRLYYWEHFGLLDNPEYCKSCQEKLEIYAHYGYFPGENLIITSESSNHGLNMEYVDCLIERYLK